jgi:hypothetical protein
MDTIICSMDSLIRINNGQTIKSTAGGYQFSWYIPDLDDLIVNSGNWFKLWGETYGHHTAITGYGKHLMLFRLTTNGVDIGPPRTRGWEAVHEDSPIVPIVRVYLNGGFPGIELAEFISLVSGGQYSSGII